MAKNPKPVTPNITATYSSDGYIVLNISALHGNSSDNTPDSLLISRWNQYDGTWGNEQEFSNATYNAGSPGTTTAHRTYRWRVRGYTNRFGFNTYGDYGYSDYVQTTPPAPVGGAAWLSGPAAISMTWQDTGYRPHYHYATEVWWNINGGGWGHKATVPAGTTSHYVDGLVPGATYQFAFRHVSTQFGTTASPFLYTGTTTALVAPNATGALTATRNGDATATLSWANNANGGAPYDSLTLQRWDNVGNTWDTIANLGGGSTTATDNGLVTGRKYQWRIAANNAVGSSAFVYSGNVFTTPNAPGNVVARYTGGTSVSVTWNNNDSYTEYGPRVQAYKNGVVDGSVVSLNAGETTYTKTSVDVLATYTFKVWAVSNVGSLTSPQATSNAVSPAAPPGAPVGLTMSAGVIDLAKDYSIGWKHTPSVDGSAQVRYQLRHRVQGDATWIEDASVMSSSESAFKPFATHTNGQIIEWQVRTRGVHASLGPWSGSALLYTSTTPTVNITGPGATVVNSTIPIAWSYFDEQGTPQAEYRLSIFESVSGKLVATKAEVSSASSVLLPTTVTDGLSYRLELAVRDGAGLWSTTVSKTFTAAFTPPAEVLLSVDIDGESGAAVLTLTPTPHDNGLTKYPASAVTVQRQFFNEETGTYDEWETLLDMGAPSGMVIDPTGPTHDDGRYRVITHSAAPSTVTSTVYSPSNIPDARWLYVSGGEKFDVICKMWANIEIEQKASRNRALHYFAGRRNPVIYSGEATERTYTVSGILEDEASDPNQWIRLARMPGAVLLRAPGRRMFGNLSEVSIKRIQHGLHQISFSVQEVSR